MGPPDPLLARFPGPVTIMPSRLKLTIGLLIFVGLTVFCVVVMVPGLPEAGAYDAIMTVLSTVVIAGITIRTAILLLVPGMVGLTLDADRFAVGCLFRAPRS